MKEPNEICDLHLLKKTTKLQCEDVSKPPKQVFLCTFVTHERCCGTDGSQRLTGPGSTAHPGQRARGQSPLLLHDHGSAPASALTLVNEQRKAFVCASGESANLVINLLQQVQKTEFFQKINIRLLRSSYFDEAYLIKIYTVSNNSHVICDALCCSGLVI